MPESDKHQEEKLLRGKGDTEKVVAIFNTEVREEEQVIAEQRPQKVRELKPCEYLKEKHFRKNSK